VRLQSIDPLTRCLKDDHMTNSTPNVLVLGGTGRTGSRLVAELAGRGLAVRTAARHGADVRFDWSDTSTHQPAVEGIDRLCLITPVIPQAGFTEQVTSFLDKAAAAGVQHITYLSAYGMDEAPPEIALRAIELDLRGRNDFTNSILRPAWFMQNFSEGHLIPVDGFITVPTGDGAEAFVDIQDIAAVAAATLTDPDTHADAQYALTGPEAMTVADAADVITTITGQPVKHRDIDRQTWVQASVAAGIPADYGGMLALLTETVASGRGSRPTNDVERVTGASATSFADFVRRTARQFAGA
jgi:uncharacterized protein YbjT (DUF2867 family)